MRKSIWIIFGLLCTLIGLYPLAYFFIDRSFGLLSLKPEALLSDTLWNIAFYGHIVLGGLALLVGWIQFNEKFRNRKIERHRLIGKLYVTSVLISGISGLYISLFATGGIVSVLGFLSLDVVWLSSTVVAFNAIKNGNLRLHQNAMICSYAACFAAVSLRIWLPLLSAIFEDFTVAYRIVSWLSWLPNMVIAYWIIRRKA